MHRGPQHVVERSSTGDPAAEVVEIGGAPGRQAHGLDLVLEPRREVADDDRHHEEEDHVSTSSRRSTMKVWCGSVKKKL